MKSVSKEGKSRSSPPGFKGGDHIYCVLIESMNEGAVTFTPDGVILYSNAGFAKMVNYKLDKVVGSSIFEFIAPNECKDFGKFLRSRKSKKSKEREINLYTAAHTLLPVLLSLSPLETDARQSFYSVIITDLTEFKRKDKLAASEQLSIAKLKHEKEIRGHVEKLAQELVIEKSNLQKEIVRRRKLEHQKDEFIGIASHELKTPVTSIKAYAQILERRFRKAGDFRSVELVRKMDSQLNKLTGLIGDLLDATKIEGGKLQFHQTKFDFQDLVREVVEQTQPTTDQHRIKTILDRPVVISGDRDRIGQVIINLLSNAIKYSPEADKIIVSSEVMRDEVSLTVQDFGIGIPREMQSKVFERFYRVKGKNKDTYPGLGLGLYISAEIVKRQRGRFVLKSKEGEGSSFTFYLPIKRKRIRQQHNDRVQDEMKHE